MLTFDMCKSSNTKWHFQGQNTEASTTVSLGIT